MSFAVSVVGLIGIVALLGAGALRSYRRSGDGPVIFIMRRLSWLYCGLWHGMRERRGCTIPDRGPALVISNHVSSIDPFLLQHPCSKRVISFMVAREFYELPGLG